MFEKRCELKFTTNNSNYYLILNWIKSNTEIFSKHYPPRLVNSIYFDTFSYDSYKENIYGLSKKTKIRYRWYEDFFKNDNGFLEIKKRENIFNYKKIYKVNNLKINKKSNLKVIANKIKPKLDQEGLIEFQARPFPTIINQYFREYFINFNKNIRITIDKNIKIFDQRLSNKINLDVKTLYQDLMVVEFKFNESLFNKINELLRFFPIKSSKNSKYINAIRCVSAN